MTCDFFCWELFLTGHIPGMGLSLLEFFYCARSFSSGIVSFKKTSVL